MQAVSVRARALYSGFSAGQRVIVVLAVAGLLLGAFALARWVSQPAWGPLYGNLAGSDANAIVEQLQAKNVPYKLADGGTTVLVPQSQVYNLRVSLSGQGLPASTGTGGWSLLDSQGMTATDFQQNVAYQRAMEGELAKTLQAIQGVQAAVVHLAIPKKDVFATEADKPTASVLLALQTGTTLDQRQVLAVTHLVAGSVPGMDPANVTVTDSTGKLLSTAGVGAAGAASAAGDTDAQTAQYEDRLGTSVQQMLDRVLGAGRAVVRVNAVLDYNATESTSETYATNTAQPLSQATVHETYSGSGAGAGGALGQSAPTLSPTPGASGAGNYQRDQNTVNNAVGKIVSKTDAAPGAIQRLTVAVVLDTKTVTADPNQISQLVANAVGLNPQRGDAVQVEKIPFDTTANSSAAKELAAAQAQAKTVSYIDLAKKAALGLVLLIAGLVMLRKRRKAAKVEASAGDLVPRQYADQYYLPGPGMTGLPGTAGMPAIEGIDPAVLALAAAPDKDPVLEREVMREQVSQLVDNQADDVAAVIQGWLAERRTG